MKDSILLEKADKLAHICYRITKSFPREEVYGLTSQIRRSATSVPVNIEEGFGRKSGNSYKHFLTISYGSLRELKYFLRFSKDEGLISETDYKEAFMLSEECGKMLWKTIDTVSKKERNTSC